MPPETRTPIVSESNNPNFRLVEPELITKMFILITDNETARIRYRCAAAGLTAWTALVTEGFDGTKGCAAGVAAGAAVC